MKNNEQQLDTGHALPLSADQTGQQKVKVLIVDDHQIVRDCLKKILNSEEELMVVGEASDGRTAVQLAGEISPDVILMDVNLPVMDGVEATEEIRINYPAIQVVGLSLYDQMDVMNGMLDAGAVAYINKNDATEMLNATVKNLVNRPRK